MEEDEFCQMEIERSILESSKLRPRFPDELMNQYNEREEIERAIRKSLEEKEELDWVQEIENRIAREKREKLMMEQNIEYKKSIIQDRKKDELKMREKMEKMEDAESGEETEPEDDTPKSLEELRQRRLQYFENMFGEKKIDS